MILRFCSIRKKHKTAFLFSLVVVIIYWKILTRKVLFEPISDKINTEEFEIKNEEEFKEEYEREPNKEEIYNEEESKTVDNLESNPGSESDMYNIYKPDEYDSSGCPIVPIAFSGMMGRLGNVMCVYSNFIALQWKLGFKYFLPKYMNHHTDKDITKPYFQDIFKNVSFPTATWTNVTTLARNAEKNDLVLFNNSRTNYQEISCNKHFHRVDHLQPMISDQLSCANHNKCAGKSCLDCKGSCPCTNIWVTQAQGANYLDLGFVGDVLENIIHNHLQFKDHIEDAAAKVIENVARKISADDETHFVGVHVRRSDFKEYSKFWIKELLNETFFESAMDHFRRKHSKVVFLVVTDDIPWCKAHLTSPDTHLVGTPWGLPEVDMAIMGRCNSSIIDYGTFGMWGAILAGGETVTSKDTFMDVRWAADYFGWTYV